MNVTHQPRSTLCHSTTVIIYKPATVNLQSALENPIDLFRINLLCSCCIISSLFYFHSIYAFIQNSCISMSNPSEKNQLPSPDSFLLLPTLKNSHIMHVQTMMNCVDTVSKNTGNANAHDCLYNFQKHPYP